MITRAGGAVVASLVGDSPSMVMTLGTTGCRRFDNLIVDPADQGNGK
jgi:hypothetical protein